MRRVLLLIELERNRLRDSIFDWIVERSRRMGMRGSAAPPDCGCREISLVEAAGGCGGGL